MPSAIETCKVNESLQTLEFLTISIWMRMQITENTLGALELQISKERFHTRATIPRKPRRDSMQIKSKPTPVESRFTSHIQNRELLKIDTM